MKILKVLENNINLQNIEAAVDVLRGGGLIIYPTDTLYALGCDALNNNAVSKICKIKGINPEKQYLSIVCDSISMVSEYAKYDNMQFKLMKHNLPGPFTFIFQSTRTLPKVFKGRRTVGIRIPSNKIATTLTSSLGHPIMTTTIPFEDEDYAINPELIAEAYQSDVDVVIDGGYGGLEPSTIVDLSTGSVEILRRGKGELIQ